MTCACVGDEHYLTSQFLSLARKGDIHPSILSTQGKIHFGKLYRQFHEVWQQLLDDTGIEFDLLYDPPGWLSLLQHLKGGVTTVPILYIHQGGLLGNVSMLARYRRKYSP